MVPKAPSAGGEQETVKEEATAHAVPSTSGQAAADVSPAKPSPAGACKINPEIEKNNRGATTAYIALSPDMTLTADLRTQCQASKALVCTGQGASEGAADVPITPAAVQRVIQRIQKKDLYSIFAEPVTDAVV